MVSDGEVVSKSANGFRLASGNTGVILRIDGRDFYALTTADGQAQDGQWNTLRPFSFSLSTGRVSLRNGVDISGGAVVSYNAGISTSTTGPSPSFQVRFVMPLLSSPISRQEMSRREC